MANIRKLSAFRQLSLNCESPKEKRNFLKKQLSEDLTEVNNDSNFKQQFDNKGNKIKNRPIKIAWDDEPLFKDEEPVIVKKCKEIKRPITTTRKLTKQPSIDKDSILYSKQNLAKRLRQVFENTEERKLNLNIFLTQNYHQENAKEADFNEAFCEIESRTTADSTTPKIRPPLLRTTTTNNNNNNMDNGNLFQIRRNKHELISPAASSPPKTVVVVPIKEAELSAINVPKPIDNVIIRPNTAAMKREHFQKRTNSAFNATIKEEIKVKPPLVRAVSAPISKTDKSKSKFIASKRKMIKTNRKKKIKEGSDDDINNNNDINNNSNNNGSVKSGILEKLGNEVVTMVSLVSPSASDCEDSSTILPIDKAQMKLKKDDFKPNKNQSLRKTIKSVSFQQSTIHAIRSFSASFPARRNNNSMLVANNRLKNPNLQDKQTTIRNSMMNDDVKDEQNDQNSPKRKLLKDTQGENCIKDNDNDNENNQKLNNKTNITVNITNKTTKQQINSDDDLQEEPDETLKIHNNTDKNDKNQERNHDLIADNDGKKLKFGSVKEKECWEMFHKMTDRGIKISYDAILRGMLTPTEYRLRNKEIVENQLEK